MADEALEVKFGGNGKRQVGGWRVPIRAAVIINATKA